MNRALRFGRSVVFVAALVPLVAAGADTTNSRDRSQAVRATLQNFVAAWNGHDTNRLLQMFTPKGSFKSPSGTAAHGREAIRQQLTIEHARIYKGTALSFQPRQIRFPKSGKARVTGSYTLDGIQAVLFVTVAAQGSFEFRMTQTDGGWRIDSARVSRD